MNHQLLRPFRHRARPEIDTVGQVEPAAGDAEAPTGARSGSQQGGSLVLLQGDLDVGVKMKPRREGVNALADDGVLAAQVAPGGVDIKAPAVDEAQSFLVAVMAGAEPAIAVYLAAVAGDVDGRLGGATGFV